MSGLLVEDFTPLGEFADPRLEQAYQEAKWPQTCRRMRYVCLLTATLYLAAVWVDYLALGWGMRFGAMVAGRLTAFLAGVTTAACTQASACTPRRLGWALCCYMLSVMFCEALELTLKPDGLPGGLPAAVVIVLTYYLFLPPRTWPTLVAAVPGSLVYLAVLAVLSPSPEDVWVTGLFFGLVNGFGVYFLTRFGLAQRREFLAFLRVKEMAEIDSLTQVYNRRRILELGERLLKQARRYGEPLSVLVLDIDHFKTVNDRHGHAVGDQVLRLFAEGCQEELREVDLFGRLGGEEFVALLPHSDLEQAVVAAERVRAAVSATAMAVAPGGLCITVSIGAAQLRESDSMDMLVCRADKALYRAKLEGRNRVRAWRGASPAPSSAPDAAPDSAPDFAPGSDLGPDSPSDDRAESPASPDILPEA